MTVRDPRFDRAVAALDAIHAEDPTTVCVAGRDVPAELAYAERMTAALARIAPEASEALRLAARAQHLARFRIPRTSRPEGRAGYLAWRAEQKRAHAALARDVLAAAGYEEHTQERVARLVEKRGLGSDPEAQLLEDCACLVFLEHYLEDFARGRPEEHIIEILRKTWRKMGPVGRAHAPSWPMSERARRLVELALAERRAD